MNAPVLLLLATLPRLEAPPVEVTLADLDRFPSQAQARACWQFAAEHLRYLDCEIDTCPAHERDGWCAWRQEHQGHYDAWDALDDATRLPGPESRLEALKRLRRLLGPEDWHAGRMPLPFPGHRFRRVD